MPIYRYRCSECGAQKEHLQKVSDPPLETCEACGGALAKQMTAAAFHLKGGGWYKDLYSSSKADGGSKQGAGAETSAKSESSSSGSSDSAGSSSGASTSTSSTSTASSSAPSAA